VGSAKEQHVELSDSNGPRKSLTLGKSQKEETTGGRKSGRLTHHWVGSRGKTKGTDLAGLYFRNPNSYNRDAGG